MAKFKSQIRRLAIIDSLIRSHHYPTKEEFIWWINDKTDMRVCASSIEKDINLMREKYDAPIAYSKLNKGYQYTDEYNLSIVFLQDWGQYFDFPKQVKEFLYNNEEQI